MRYLKPTLFLLLVCFLIMGSQTKEVKLTEGIQPGNLAPEINRQDINLKGKKFVLLQFWAAYDARSRMLNAQMHNVISQSGTEDIRLVSVSFDENEAVFKGVVKADRLNPATQFNDPQGKNSEIFKTYHLESGFGNRLINSEGIIIAKDVNPQEILGYIGR
ncbi:MAG: thioredoxin family protein [Candidatus Azobacteroides sp.]|nr:thioredoxin family protein [Candidatus Azobacteroides sp.]